MELATAALSSLLPKLATLLTDEYKLQKGVKGEIRFLQAEIESMQAALTLVSKLPPYQIDDLLGIWVRDLKELSYDIEDSVDSFMLQVDAPAGCAKPSSFRKFFDRTIGLLTKAIAQHHMADDIQDIKRCIHEVGNRRERYKFDDVMVQQPAENTTLDPRLTVLYEEVKNLVGLDGPTGKLVDLIMHGGGARAGAQKQEQLMVVSILVVGGLGKTTLANSMYQRLRGEFHSQSFVSVSIKPGIKKIFISILRQVSQDELLNVEAWDHTELIDKIREVLKEKRYIIIIDDVWGKPAWTQIKCALLENNLGSRVIVTTRNIDVAKFSCSSIDDTMYELDPLSDEDSKRLLCKRLFTGDEEIRPELEEVSRKILKKCGGIPLAIITTPSLLASRPNKSKYQWYGVYESMGSGLEKDKTIENMREILYLSYRDLPSYLKPCLLSPSMFPEDHQNRRLQAPGVSHHQGSQTLPIYMRNWTRAHGGQPINSYTGFCLSHKGKSTAPDNVYNLEDGPEAYTNPTAYDKATQYTAAARQRYGETFDPTAEPLDLDLITRLGPGKQHGRYFMANSAIDPTQAPTLSSVRSQPTSSSDVPSAPRQPPMAQLQARIEERVEQRLSLIQAQQAQMAQAYQQHVSQLTQHYQRQMQQFASAFQSL